MWNKFNLVLLATMSLLLGSVGQARADTTVYATAENGLANLFGTMDLTTGQFTQISTTGIISGLVFQSLTTGSDGTIYSAVLYGDLAGPPCYLDTISPSGVVSPFGTVRASGNFGGFLGLASAGAAGFFADSVTPSTGTFTAVLDRISADGNNSSVVGTLGTSFGSLNSGKSFNSGNLAFGPDGNLYFDALNANEVATLYAVNTATGVATAIGSGLGSPDPLALTSDGATLYGIDTVALTNPTIYTINTTTGAATAIGTVSGLPTGSTFRTMATSTVPEPSTLILASIAGLFSLCFVWRRRKANLAA
ncbi:MAG: PEP-CTERM sorting domain-containing protein [Thermoguttaceae bacterium]